MIIAEALQEGNLDASTHPSHRRLDESTKTAIETISRRISIRARDIRAVIQEQFPDSNFTQRDIYNARALINRKKLDRYSSSTALIKLFHKRRIPYIVK
ncbi:mutator-like element [Colletotrichum sojae]|uniref:Mutator-like element n=1 Tax=Colletotrichum sojae TaxID=2175907 RepID=A0A8H6IPE4_9PEZI|nr:mutator-like element [Colletotrichum sojae]